MLALAKYLSSRVGVEAEVLVERDGIGRTPHFAEVRLDAPVPGTVQRVAIVGADVTHLRGEVMP